MKDIAPGQKPEIVSKGNPLREDHENVLSLVIESGDNRSQPEDITRLTGWDKSAVLTILKELERVGVVRSEVIDLHTERWYTLTEEA